MFVKLVRINIIYLMDFVNLMILSHRVKCIIKDLKMYVVIVIMKVLILKKELTVLKLQPLKIVPFLKIKIPVHNVWINTTLLLMDYVNLFHRQKIVYKELEINVMYVMVILF